LPQRDEDMRKLTNLAPIGPQKPCSEWTAAPGIVNLIPTARRGDGGAGGRNQGGESEPLSSVWLGEHPPLYTAGTSAKLHVDLLEGPVSGP